jgi:hypothetical protein
MYPGQPYPGVANPLWGQPNPTGIPQQGTFPNQSVNPMIPTQQPPQTQYMGGPSGQPHTWGDHQVNHSTWEDHQSTYMGGPSGQPQYMGGQPQYMGGPSGFSIPSQPIYGPVGVPMSHGYYQYPQAN